MRTALHFGAEKIGRGFLAQFYCEAGVRIVFVDVRDDLVTLLQSRDAYPIRFMTPTQDTVTITNFTAVHARESEAVAEAFATADFVSTAVGERNLGAIAKSIAPGIAARRKAQGPPVDILVCENGAHAAHQLRTELLPLLSDEDAAWAETHVGLVDAIIGRMVPEADPKAAAEDPLIVTPEPYANIYLDAAAFRAAPLEHPHVLAVDNYPAYDARKLMMHNMGHAATAYLGYLHGHQTIAQAIGDASVRTTVEGAMGETAEALYRRHGLPLDESAAHAADLIARFANPLLGDTVARVAGDPLRKLGPDDRLIGAARLCDEESVAPEQVTVACAAALAYDDSRDPMAAKLQSMIQEGGVATVLDEICGIGANHPLAARITQHWENLRTQRAQREG